MSKSDKYLLKLPYPDKLQRLKRIKRNFCPHKSILRRFYHASQYKVWINNLNRFLGLKNRYFLINPFIQKQGNFIKIDLLGVMQKAGKPLKY